MKHIPEPNPWPVALALLGAGAITFVILLAALTWSHHP